MTEFNTVRSVENISQYSGAQQLAIVSGWSPGPLPQHRALEREAAEAIDQAERDYAARLTFSRRAAQ
jgi:hypothetical protein